MSEIPIEVALAAWEARHNGDWGLLPNDADQPYCRDSVARVIWGSVCNLGVRGVLDAYPCWLAEWRYERRTLNCLVKVNYIGDDIGNR